MTTCAINDERNVTLRDDVTLPNRSDLFSSFAELQNRAWLGPFGRGRRAFLSEARDHRSPSGVDGEVHVIPPTFGNACIAPRDRIWVTEDIMIVVIGKWNWHRDRWTTPHDAAGADAEILANLGISGFVNDDGELFEIAGKEEANKVARVDDTNKIGGHVAKPVPLVQYPVRGCYTALNLSARPADVLDRTSVAQNIILLAELESEGANDPRTIDVSECVGLARRCTPAWTKRGLHLTDLHENVRRTFGMSVHPLAKNSHEIRLGNHLLWHWLAPFRQKLTSNRLRTWTTSPFGKQIVNVTQLFLNSVSCVSHQVRFFTERRYRHDAPVGVEAIVCDAGDLNRTDAIASRQSLNFLQCNKFKILLLDQLLRQGDTPVLVASQTFGIADRSLQADGCLVDKLPIAGSGFQIVARGELEAASDYVAPKTRIIVVAAGHGSPGFVHWDDDYRPRPFVCRVDLQQHRQQISQVIDGLFRTLRHRLSDLFKVSNFRNRDQREGMIAQSRGWGKRVAVLKGSLDILHRTICRIEIRLAGHQIAKGKGTVVTALCGNGEDLRTALPFADHLQRLDIQLSQSPFAFHDVTPATELSDQTMRFGDPIADLGNPSGNVSFNSLGKVMRSVGAKSAPGAPAVADAKYLHEDIRGHFALLAKFVFDDQFKLSRCVSDSHATVLMVLSHLTMEMQSRSDLSAWPLRRGRSFVDASQLRIVILVSDVDPALDDLVGIFPMCGDHHAAAFVDAISECSERSKSLALGHAYLGKRVGGGLLGCEAKDEAAGLVVGAVERSSEHRAAVPSLQETYSVGHVHWLAVRDDPVCAVTNTKVSSSISTRDVFSLHSADRCADHYGTGDCRNEAMSA